jgi:MinD superfamily P-loop ATPase
VGRTSIALELCRNAALNGHTPVLLADFDIEKPDLIKMADESGLKTEKIYGTLPVIDISHCRYCGICAGYCSETAIRFNRYVPSVSLVVSRCISCGNCLKACTRNGIRMLQKLSGNIVEGRIDGIPLIAGQLQEFGQFHKPLIKALLERIKPDATVICDFAPGNDGVIGDGLQGMDLAILVMEPEAEWETKLAEMLKAVNAAGIPSAVLLNKVTDEQAIIEDIKAYCATHVIPLPGIIPLIADHSPGSATHSGSISSEVFSETWKNLAELLTVNTLSQKNISKK